MGGVLIIGSTFISEIYEGKVKLKEETVITEEEQELVNKRDNLLT